MDDLISRQKAIDAFRDTTDLMPECYARDIIADLPSAQPDLCDGCDRYGASCVGEGCGKLEMPEIIKCKDCKHHRQNDYGDSWCAHPKGLDGFDLMPTDFCSRAERRTDGTEPP